MEKTIEEILSRLDRKTTGIITDSPTVSININIYNITYISSPAIPEKKQEDFQSIREAQKKAVLKEKEAFLRMEEELEKKYFGKFVAIFNGEVIGVDEDEGRLIMSVYKERGYIPIYVRCVGEKERIIRIPSPRIRQGR